MQFVGVISKLMGALRCHFEFELPDHVVSDRVFLDVIRIQYVPLGHKMRQVVGGGGKGLT